jgi:hypothetical protein
MMKDFNTALQELISLYKNDKEKSEEEFRNISCVINLQVEVTLGPGEDDKPGTYNVLLHPLPNGDEDGSIDAWDETGLTVDSILSSLNIDSSNQIWESSKP